MKIHSDTLTQQDIRDAVPENCFLATMDDGYFIREEGSRSRARGFVVRLSGTSRHTMDSRRLLVAHKSATYDEWGFFLAALFAKDDNAICGDYKGGRDFMEKTNEAFPIHAHLHSVKV